MVNIPRPHHPSGESVLGEAMLKFERDMARQGRRPKLPCDERGAKVQEPKWKRDRVERENIKREIKRIEAWNLIISQIEVGEIFNVRDIFERTASCDLSYGFLSRSAITVYLTQIAEAKITFALPRVIEGNPTQYMRLDTIYREQVAPERPPEQEVEIV